MPAPISDDANTVVRNGPGSWSNISRDITDDELRARITELGSYERLSKSQADELGAYRAALSIREERRERLRQAASNPAALESVNAADVERERAERSGRTDPTGRDRARRRLDEIARDGRLGVPDDGLERLTRAFDRAESDSPAELDLLSKWTLVTSDPAYARAVGKLFRDPEQGHREFDGAELNAYQAGKALQRAMAEGTGSAGGFLLPFQLDPTIIINNAGVVDPIRQVARTAIIASNVWHGITSAGVVASWDAENTEVSDDSPTLAQPAIPTYKGAAWVAASIEAAMDTTIANQVGVLFADAKANLEGTAFLTGNGTSAPQGVITGLAAGQKVATATADVLVPADVTKPLSALSARWQANATSMANIPTTLAMQAMETTAGALRYPELKDNPARLLTTPYYVHSGLATAGTATGSANDNVLLVGDFLRGYVIADRIGTTVEYIPHVFGASGRPLGQRGWYCYWRTGGGVVVQDAFRLLTA